MSKIPLHYHFKTIRELWGSSEVSPMTEETEVLALEQRLGVTLPPSVREWVRCFGKLRYLAGQDDALELNEWRLSDDYLIFMSENQYCAFWAVRLDGSDDPPVYYASPRQLEEGQADWELVTKHFSTFTCSRAWSHNKVAKADYGWLTTGANFEFRAQALLRALYREGPFVNDWPCGDHHHFTNERAYLWTIGRQWWLGSDRQDSFLKMTSEVWGELTDRPDGMSDESWPLLQAFQPPAAPGPGWNRIFADDLSARFADGNWLESPSDRSLTDAQWKDLTQKFTVVKERKFKRRLKATHLLRGNQRIYVMTQSSDGYPRQSCWWIHANDPAELAELARFVCQFGDLRKTLHATTPAGVNILKQLRS